MARMGLTDRLAPIEDGIATEASSTPFVWSKTPDQVVASVAHFCTPDAGPGFVNV